MLGCAAQEEKQEKVSALESEVSQLAHSSESEIAALKLKLSEKAEQYATTNEQQADYINQLETQSLDMSRLLVCMAYIDCSHYE